MQEYDQMSGSSCFTSHDNIATWTLGVNRAVRDQDMYIVQEMPREYAF